MRKNLFALAADKRIGVPMRKEDIADSRRDNRIGTRRRTPKVATRFKRHVQGRASRRVARIPKSHHFRMGTVNDLRVSAPDNDTVPYDDSPDRRIGKGDSYRRQGLFKSRFNEIHP